MSRPRLYEGMFLIDSNLAVKDWSAIETYVQDLLKKYHAELLYSEKWPDRRLAHDVKGCKKGTYFLTYFNSLPGAIREIERDVVLSERILRHLIIQEPGLAREMERRRNREITAPPAELTFGMDDRFDSRDSGFGRHRRTESAMAPAIEAPPILEEAGESAAGGV